MKTLIISFVIFLAFVANGFAAGTNDNPPQQKAAFPLTSSDLKEKQRNEYYQQNSSNNGNSYNSNQNNYQKENTNNNKQSYLQPAQFPKTTKRCPKCSGAKCADCGYQGYIVE